MVNATGLRYNSLPYGLQHVGDDGVVPEVGEPHPGSLHVHGAGQEEPGSCTPQSGGGETPVASTHLNRPSLLRLNRAPFCLPMVTSEELCASRKRLRWCQTRGIQSMILTSSMLRVRLPISVSISFLLRDLPSCVHDPLVCLYLAGLVVHVEGDDSVRGQRSALQQQQVPRQLIGQVGLPRAAGARQDDAAVLLQQGDVALQHRLGDQRVEHQRVHVVAPHTWTHTARHSGHSSVPALVWLCKRRMDDTLLLRRE
ncbi:hypothetical protein EYF80_030830 [Liparis tanakae]|uniref:Uncharacterized protein n=1 Tax=Liparis tanakae TaxID=230148 RepID=A0A4Z2GZ57_9TELE|nr:hypothetical protein EYF80_030830 [Liparis tanakae]